MKLIRFNNSPAFPENFENLFNDNFFGSNQRWNNVPATNIIEHKNEYELELAVPGYEKKDFKIDLEQNMLTISSTKEENHEENTKDYSRKEFSSCSFSRSFTLPETIDKEKIQANYENGILHVSLPKVEEVKKLTKEIKVA